MLALPARSPIACASHRIWIVTGMIAIAGAGCRSAGPSPAPATATAATSAQRAPFANAFPLATSQEPLALAPPAISAAPVLAEVLMAPPARVIADLNAVGRELPIRLGDQM